MKKFFKDSFLTILTNLINLFLGVIITVLIARLLGPEKKGIYTLAILLPTIVVKLTNFGIKPSTVHFTGKKQFSYSRIINNSIFIAIFLSLLAFFIGAVSIFGFKNNFFSGISTQYLWVSLFIIPLSIFFKIFSGILQGQEDFKKFNLIKAIKKGSFFVLLIFVYLYPYVLTVLWVRIGILLISVIFLFYWIINSKPEINFDFQINYFKKVFGYGLKAHLSNIITFFNYRFDMMLINSFLNPVEVGYYSIAVSVSEKVWILSRSVSTVILPRISSLDSKKRMKSITALTSRIVVCLTFIGILILYILSDFLIPILFSKEYISSIFPLKILLIGVFSMSFTRVLANDLSGRGLPEYNIYTAVLNLVINISLNIFLIPRYGIIGAAVATTVSYTAQGLLTTLIYIKVSQNNIFDILFLKFDDIKLIFNFLLKRS